MAYGDNIELLLSLERVVEDRDKAEARVAALEAALQAIADESGDDPYDGSHDEWTESLAFDHCRLIAKAALDGDGGAEPSDLA